MRVIGGTFGGRRLRAVEGHGTRPTSDRVREALFSRLEARYRLEGAAVLDVFAGTGALAIEALSRGAASATCIETGRRAQQTLRENLRELGLSGRVRVVEDDFRRALARLATRFEGVFIDPPYAKGLALDALAAVAELGLVRAGGWVTVEVGRREQLPEAVEGLQVTLVRMREDAYGDTRLVLYEAHGAAARNEHVGDAESPTAEVER